MERVVCSLFERHANQGNQRGGEQQPVKSSRTPPHQIDAICVDDILWRFTEKSQSMVTRHVAIGIRHDYHAAIVEVGMPLGENAPKRDCARL